jgi:hypothetical protein
MAQMNAGAIWKGSFVYTDAFNQAIGHLEKSESIAISGQIRYNYRSKI